MRVYDEHISEEQLSRAWDVWAAQEDRTYQTLVGALNREGVPWHHSWRAADRLLQKKRKEGVVRYAGRRRWELV